MYLLRLIGAMSAFTILGLAQVTPAAATPGQASDSRPHAARKGGPRATVLPSSETRQFGLPAAGYWRPTGADLRHLEADMSDTTNGLPGGRDLLNYYRQYLGFTQDGRRLIYVNAFSSSVAADFIGGKNDWHRHAAWVMDGGNAFFHAVYDPHTRRFTGFQFNGLG